MEALTVLYDPDCGLCRRAHDWLAGQAKLIELIFVPCASDEARQRFPELNHELTKTDLTVIDSRGAIYFGPKAWLMVLWALAGYREWSYTRSSNSEAR
jgi:predicted DCC family thiol-disulfide oxidoreductase YuxK